MRYNRYDYEYQQRSRVNSWKEWEAYIIRKGELTQKVEPVTQGKKDKIGAAVVLLLVIGIVCAIALPIAIQTEGEKIQAHQDAIKKQHRPQRMEAAANTYINRLTFTPTHYQVKCLHNSKDSGENTYDYYCKARNPKGEILPKGNKVYGLVVKDDGAGDISVGGETTPEN